MLGLNKMKLLVATYSDQKCIDAYGKFTIPIIENYAKECGADFINMSINAEVPFGEWNYVAMHTIYKLFDTYDRILYMDSDILISKGCPNLFNVTEGGIVFAGVSEDVGSRKENRVHRLKDVQNFYEKDSPNKSPIALIRGYINAGMYLASKYHQAVFQPVNGKLYNKIGYDSPHISYQLFRLGYYFWELDYKWNHMSMFSEAWNGSPSRFDSYFIHYAGDAKFPDKGKMTRNELIKSDWDRIWN